MRECLCIWVLTFLLWCCRLLAAWQRWRRPTHRRVPGCPCCLPLGGGWVLNRGVHLWVGQGRVVQFQVLHRRGCRQQFVLNLRHGRLSCWYADNVS